MKDKIATIIVHFSIAFTGVCILGFLFGGCEMPESFNPGDLGDAGTDTRSDRACKFDTLVGYGYMYQCANGDKLCFLYDGTFADTECVYKDSRAPLPFYCAEGCK